MTESGEAVEIICPNCKHTQIIYVPQEEMPDCPKCGTRMMIRELLKEGKSY
jgi:ribosomal protein S27E